MAKREYVLDFYQLTASDDKHRPQPMTQCFIDWANHGVPNADSLPYEVRQLKERHDFVCGVVSKLRLRDIPHAAQAGAPDHALDLDDDEGLIEKAHFSLRVDSGVMVLQRNRTAVGALHFAVMLSRLTGWHVSLTPIATQNAMQRLQSQKNTIRKVELRIARPNGDASITPAISDNPRWNDAVVNALSDSGGYAINVTITGKPRAVGQNRFLGAKVLSGIKSLLHDQDSSVERARVSYDDEDSDDPGYVDLLLDRIIEKTEVEADDHYPNASEMWRAQRDAYTHRLSEIKDVLSSAP